MPKRDADTAAITIGTLADVLGGQFRPMGLASRILTAYDEEISGWPCLRCRKPLRAVLCDGSRPGRRLLHDGVLANWYVCDSCDADMQREEKPG